MIYITIYILIGMVINILGCRGILRAFNEMHINNPFDKSILVAIMIIIWPAVVYLKFKDFMRKLNDR